MNCHDRRSLRATLKAAAGRLVHPVPESVHLEGGPMDGWLVTPAAAALREDWWLSWPPFIADAWHPGRYARAQGRRLPTAVWEPEEAGRVRR